MTKTKPLSFVFAHTLTSSAMHDSADGRCKQYGKDQLTKKPIVSVCGDF